MRKVLFLGLVLILLSAPTWAQSFEIGAGFGPVKIAEIDDFWDTGVGSRGFDVHGTIALNSRFALEPLVSYGRHQRPPEPQGYGVIVTGGNTRLTEGVFGLIVRQRLLKSVRPGFFAFLTYGMVGIYQIEHTPERQYRYQASPPYPSQVYTEPARSYSIVLPISFPVFGAGFEKSIGDHLALRVDAQGLTWLFIPTVLGARASVSVVVPIGSFSGGSPAVSAHRR